MAIPILLIGLVEVTLGYTVHSRSDAQRKDIVSKMDLYTRMPLHSRSC
jgi:hypothetical protein